LFQAALKKAWTT